MPTLSLNGKSVTVSNAAVGGLAEEKAHGGNEQKYHEQKSERLARESTEQMAANQREKCVHFEVFGNHRQTVQDTKNRIRPQSMSLRKLALSKIQLNKNTNNAASATHASLTPWRDVVSQPTTVRINVAKASHSLRLMVAGAASAARIAVFARLALSWSDKGRRYWTAKDMNKIIVSAARNAAKNQSSHANCALSAGGRKFQAIRQCSPAVRNMNDI